MDLISQIPLRKIVYLSLGIAVVTLLITLIVQRNLPPVVPLFYGYPEGEEQLAPSLYIALPSFIAIVISLANVAITFIIKDVFLKKTLIAAGFVVTLFSTITTLKIIFLVGSF